MKKISLIVIMMFLGISVYAQGILNVRINEVLVVNEDNIVDDYGIRESWIELFNTGYEKVNLAGCYLGVRYADRYDSDGNKQIKKYYIPKSDPNTGMSSQEYKLFYCEGTDTKGTFYTNFTLNSEDKADMIILYNANGKDVISVFKFPDNYEPVADVSLGIIGHEEPESYIFPSFSRKEKREWKAQGIDFSGDFMLDQIAAGLKYQPQVMQKTTPNATNEAMADIPRHEVFRMSDPNGVVMTLTAMAVVFSALILIFLIIKVFGMIMISRQNKIEAKDNGESVIVQKTGKTEEKENIAAIALALKLFNEDLHDHETGIITIDRVSRPYSPWNSKIYSMRRMPDKKIK